ncbi:drug/metabolite transporter permease [Klebsiella pneumoniae]|uniref:Drug/metabolite transporter permease n=1 Tax=Klebsiella pneumoniae TaxID=573 RepID=A0A2X3EEM4_KLEPN|nr:drug/metabolite transporter permease [Klebsiella pneumoniae]
MCRCSACLIGFIFWYKGLAAGGIAAVGQLQLLQPFFGLGLSAALLHETVSPLMLAVTLGVGAVRGGLAQIWPPTGWRRERGQQLT